MEQDNKVVKRAGDFIFAKLENGEFAIASIKTESYLAGQMFVCSKMRGIANYTGKTQDLMYEGRWYNGILFKSVNEETLIHEFTPFYDD